MSKGFTVLGTYITYYGIIIGCAMLIAVFLSQHLAKKRGVNPDNIITLALIVIPCSIIGARLYFCIFSDSTSMSEFFKIRDGGIAIYGGIIGGALGIVAYALFKKDFKLIVKLFDIIVPSLILGQAIGRWGNFINQEAYGYLVTNPKWQWFPFAVKINKITCAEWHLATFFYESMWNLVGFVLLLIVFNKSKQLGTTTGVYLMYYGMGRVWIEGLRTDSLYWGPLRVSQWLSVILIVIGIVILVHNYIIKQKGGRYEQKN